MTRRKTRPLILALVALPALAAACRDRREPPPAATAQPGPGARRPLKERLLGSWSVGPDPATLDKMRADLRRSARGDESRVRDQLQQFSDSMSRMTVEFTADAMITREGDREIASQRYQVVEESDNVLTIKAGRERDTFAFKDDDTVSARIGDLGAALLKRR